MRHHSVYNKFHVQLHDLTQVKLWSWVCDELKSSYSTYEPGYDRSSAKTTIVASKLYILLSEMNFFKSFNLVVMFQMTLGCQNGQIPQFNSIEEAIQFAEENDIPLEDLPYRK